MDKNYITALEFGDFSLNQSKLIGILNHNMTKLSTDVCWLKKLVGWQVGLMVAIGASIITSILYGGI